MSVKWGIVLIGSLLTIGIIQCQKPPDVVQRIIKGTKNITTTAYMGTKQGIIGTLTFPLKPVESLALRAEAVVFGIIGQLRKGVDHSGDMIKSFSVKLQKLEKKFVNCVKKEQFDPVKAIIMDFSTCITGKTDTLNKVIQNSLTQGNAAYALLKSSLKIPVCDDAKCFADHTSGIIAKLGTITLGVTMIAKDVGLGLAAAPATLPVCLATKPASSPAKILGSLGLNIAKCLEK